MLEFPEIPYKGGNTSKTAFKGYFGYRPLRFQYFFGTIHPVKSQIVSEGHSRSFFEQPAKMGYTQVGDFGGLIQGDFAFVMTVDESKGFLEHFPCLFHTIGILRASFPTSEISGGNADQFINLRSDKHFVPGIFIFQLVKNPEQGLQ